jgi:hypothetical protein
MDETGYDLDTKLNFLIFVLDFYFVLVLVFPAAFYFFAFQKFELLLLLESTIVPESSHRLLRYYLYTLVIHVQRQIKKVDNGVFYSRNF